MVGYGARTGRWGDTAGQWTLALGAGTTGTSTTAHDPTPGSPHRPRVRDGTDWGTGRLDAIGDRIPLMAAVQTLQSLLN